MAAYAPLELEVQRVGTTAPQVRTSAVQGAQKVLLPPVGYPTVGG